MRYDAKLKSYDIGLLNKDNIELIACCPEVDGGLPIPRASSEIQPDGKVINSLGVDVTKAFSEGANQALNLVKYYDIQVAILKAKSPSCSNALIYDGTFSGILTKGKGITVRLLEAQGIKVFDETEIEEALRYLSDL